MEGPSQARRELPSGTVTFLFTDVEASTSMLRDIGDDAFADVLLAMHSILRTAVEAGGGVVVNTEGDGCFAAFTTASGAVHAAALAQAELTAYPWGSREVRVRMGMHVGTDITPVADDYVALAVHRAARVSAAASGAQVLATADVVKASEVGEQFTDLGLFSVRDFDGPVRLYGLEFDGVARVVPRVPPAFDHQVPSYRTGLVGRDAEIAEVLALAVPGSLLTLTGPIGVGKSRLAIAALSLLSAQCPVGPWFVDLNQARERRDVGDVLGNAVGCPPGVAVDAHLDELLDGRRGVLVLDGCDHLAEAAASTADLLLDWCPTLTVIATSRTALGHASESTYPVPPLEVPVSADAGAILESTAGRLFVERFARIAPGRNLGRADIVAMCAAAAGVPMIIELAATLCAQGVSADVVETLTDPIGLVDAVLDALPPGDLGALTTLTVPHHPIVASLATAALSAVGAPPDVLDRLLNGSLLDSDLDGRLSQLALVRSRTALRLDDDVRVKVVRALLDACLSVTSGEPGLTQLDPIAATATLLVQEPLLAPAERQRLAVRFAPWWTGRLGEARSRAELDAVLALDPDGAAAAAVHLALADTSSGRVTADTEQHLRAAGRLLGEHDAVDPAMVERLRKAAEDASGAP